MREAIFSVVRSIFQLLVKLGALALWVCVKLVHEVSGLLESMLKKKLGS